MKTSRESWTEACKGVLAILSVLGGCDSSKKLAFCTGSGSSGMSFRAIENNTKVKEKSIASRRRTIAKVVAMSSVNKAIQC